jgi:hypothetical protein
LISQARKEANQRNAKASTGPRTPLGKAISSRNSRRHGLAMTILKDPIWSIEVHRLAKIFVPNSATADVDQAIRTSLTAMMEVMRVQEARNELWKIALARQLTQASGHLAVEGDGAPRGESGALSQDPEAMIALEVLPLIIKLERYQRRAEAYCRRMLEECGPHNT